MTYILGQQDFMPVSSYQHVPYLCNYCVLQVDKPPTWIYQI